MNFIERIPAVIAERLEASGDCLVWTASHHGEGYGTVWWEKRIQRVHRVVFAEVFGPIPEGLVICHACDNPPCANPYHLMAGTVQANIIDATRKGRIAGSVPGRVTCTVGGCTAKHLARGWCNAHYQRWANHGDPLTVHPESSPAKSEWDSCRRGHPFDEENTLIRANGTRQCRACTRLRYLRAKASR